MDFLFIADPLESFKIQKDSTLSMMRAAQEAGHRLWFCQSRNVLWRNVVVVADLGLYDYCALRLIWVCMTIVRWCQSLKGRGWSYRNGRVQV